MKKLLSVVLAMVLLTAVLAVSTNAYTGRSDYGEIPILADHQNEIRLDGVREGLYANAVEIPINRWRVTKTGVDAAEKHLGLADGEFGGVVVDSRTATDPTSIYGGEYSKSQPERGELSGTLVTQAGAATGSVWVVYDGEYLWIFAEVTDDDLNSSVGSVQNASSYWKSDSLEVRINWKNNNNVNDTYNAGVNYEGYLAGGKQGSSGLGAIDDGSSNPCTWLEAFSVITDTGYNVEARIDITEFEDELEGEYIGINFMINDCKENCDTSTRLMISSEQGGGGDWFPATYGQMKFAYASQPATGDMTVLYVVIAMVSALAVGGVSLIALKRKASTR